MTNKKSERAKFIESADVKDIAALAWDAMQLVSSHDPDLVKEIKRLNRWANRLFSRVIKLEKKTSKSR